MAAASALPAYGRLRAVAQNGRLRRLLDGIGGAVRPDLVRASRCHPLRSPRWGGAWVKREDELGFGISGNKLRKFASVMGDLDRRGATDVVAWGGSASNSLVGLAQLCNESGIDMHAFVRCDGALQLRPGNELLLGTLLPDSHVHPVSRQDWPSVAALAERHADDLRVSSAMRNVVTVPEGGACRAAALGASSLMLDILLNEEEVGQVFADIVIDAGTGFSAAALCVANALLDSPKRIHVVNVAASEAEIVACIHAVAAELSGHVKLAGDSVAELARHQISLHAPPFGLSFGAVPAIAAESVVRVAREEGIIVDPLYSAKVFATVQEESLLCQRSTVLVHSGGAMATVAFADKVRKQLRPSAKP